MQRYRTPERFYSLDALRGLAAVIVVLFHYRNLLVVQGKLPPDFDPSALPLYGALRLVYERGWLAVDFFFVLSGFVFFWLYAQRIHDRKISFGSFVKIRLARLYPLHIATLFAVACGQAVVSAMSQGVDYFSYSTNTPYYFTLQVLFISAWGFGSPYSFNGPVWSVSVEIFLYLVFFLMALVRPPRLIIAILVVTVGFVGMWKFGSLLGRGLLAFFAGAAVYIIYSKCIDSARCGLYASFSRLACVAVWLMVAVLWASSDLNRMVPARIAPVLMAAVVFPVTVLAFALHESRGRSILRPMAVLGDMSYSVYLLHFPLQLGMYIVLTWAGIERTVVYSGGFLLAFFALLLPLSLLSYRFFEKPLQDMIRSGFVRPSGQAA